MKIFRILIGPNLSTQTHHVEAAISFAEFSYGNRIKFETITLQQCIVDINWTHLQLNQWLDAANYVVISGHPLQNDFGPYWDHLAFLEQLREVFKQKGRNAFPPHSALRAACTQDKWEIFEALHQYMLPSFLVKRPIPGVSALLAKETLDDLYAFWTRS